jgi:hypothetical protein
MIPSVCCYAEDEIGCVLMETPMGTVRPGGVLFDHDPVSGSCYPDDNWRERSLQQDRAVVHGKHLVNSSNAQYPIPMQIGGGTPFGPTDKRPAALGVGGDMVGAPTRYGRYPAIARIRPETTATIGSVSRQSYQYIKSATPDPRPFNAFGNPPSPSGAPSRARQVDDTALPLLEAPRHNYVGLDTGYIQEQHDILQIRAMMAQRGY